jgi:chromate transporter
LKPSKNVFIKRSKEASLTHEAGFFCDIISFMNVSLKNLFLTYLKIGAFTLGGGYAMIPVVEKEIVDKKGWLEPTSFYHMISVAQAIPGMIALNSAIYVGYRLKGIKGAIVSGIGVILPAFLMMLVIAGIWTQLGDIPPLLAAFFEGVRVVVVGLILYAGYKLFLSSNNPQRLLIMALAFGLVLYLDIHPFYLIATIVLMSIIFAPKGERHDLT